MLAKSPARPARTEAAQTPSARAAPARPAGQDTIVVVGANEHNLQNVSITLPRDSLTVFTGVSGSGKSSLAFDTLFKEGQRRFLESLSPYARQFLGQMEKPKVEHVEGLSPTISIDQKTVNRNPRSTVGTITELYDHFRLLFARLGQPTCPTCKIPIASQTPQQIADRLLAEFAPDRIAPGAAPGGGETEAGPPCVIYAPMVRERKGEYREELRQWREQGYVRARIDGQPRRLEEDIVLKRYHKHTLELVLDRIRLNPANRPRLTEALEKALALTGGLVNLDVGDRQLTFSGGMTCPRCGKFTVPELEPRLFSFNDPQGACATCSGLGSLRQFTEQKLTFAERSLEQGALACYTANGNLVFTAIDVDFMVQLAKALGIAVRKPWGELPQAQRTLLLEGNSGEALRIRTVFRNPWLLLERAQADGTWPGLYAVLHFIERFVGHALERYQETSVCPACQGLRLNPVALAVRFHEHSIDALSSMTVEDAVAFFSALELSPAEQAIGKDIFREIRLRLSFLNDVGVGYVALNRAAPTLSGGEAQRIRLASQLGSGLQGVLYILDEPSIGLHQTDNKKLIRTLKRLRDAGNTVFVVEHDQETIESADHLVDLGPGAGSQGGRVLAQGSLADLMACPESLTGQYLAGRQAIAVPARRRAPSPERGELRIVGARRNNLAGLDVTVPLGLFVAVTGVSGSGKSTLVHDIIKRALSAHLEKQPLPRGDFKRISGLEHADKVVEIDQSPIGRTPRSNPATYTKVLDLIRGLFTELPESKVRGYKPGRFSFNVKGGRCEACEGAGVRTVEMQFLSSVEVECEECRGRRFNEETLQIQYKGRAIHEVLDMTVDEAAAFFTNVPAIAHILNTLRAVGLGYIRLGQTSTTLSGGEAQRVKLASELKRRGTGRTLYLLDEPTTGLHFHDIRSLLHCLDALVEQGNTVLVIEHNLDVIKVADYVIDLGPGGGKHGGQLVGCGTPEELVRQPASLTGQVLKPLLARPKAGRAGNGANGKPAGHRIAANPITAGKPGANGGAGQPAAGRRDLQVWGAEKNNLKHIDVTIPRNSFTVITGVSGSGKTSLAFDTIFAEGQARYVESLSTYARRFLGRMDKARVDRIDGLAPAIAIDQANSGRSPRSTVATITEISDYLRLLYARVGQPHCPHCGAALEGFSPTRLARELTERRSGERVLVLAPLFRPGSTHPAALDQPRHLAQLAPTLIAEGFTRVLLDGQTVELQEWLARPEKARKLAPGTAVDLVLDRLKVTPGERKRVAEAVEAAYARGHGLCKLVFPDAPERKGAGSDGAKGGLAGGRLPGGSLLGGSLLGGSGAGGNGAGGVRGLDGAEIVASQVPGCVTHDTYQLEPLTPRMFSFNSHVGACPDCSGLGKSVQVDAALLVPFPERPLLEGALVPGALGNALSRKGGKAERAISAWCRREGIALHRPFSALPEPHRRLLLFGDGRRLDFTQRGFGRRHRVRSTTFRGITGIVQDWYNSEEREQWAPVIEPVLADVDCPACQGDRLKPEVRAVTLGGLNISRYCAFTVEQALAGMEQWALSKTERQVAEQPLQEIGSRLGFLKDVGLAYLNLNREATTLAGGEAQRIRLASQLGSKLVGVLYVLDEPTIGLHPRDTARLLATLKQLRDPGNTVLVVEHDPETIRAADYLIDIGPGAGHRGGQVVATGTPAQVARHPLSLTGQYLSGRKRIPLPDRTRTLDWERCLIVRGAAANNLKGVTARFPLGAFVAVTGVSGSGKSTLVVEVLQKALQRQLHEARVVPGAHESVAGLEQVDQLVEIDQSPIGRSPKSSPASYSGALDGIRTLMSRMPAALQRGYAPGRFSFNVQGGRCEACEGRGYNHIEMHFLADVWVPCDVCDGKRFNRDTLDVRFRGKNIAEILDLEIGEALDLFAHQQGILRRLKSLADVGLGYMKLGQSGTTLSGGEAQRVKLASELGRPGTGRTVYILDEPTTGLHLDDTAKLLAVLHRLVDQGNTVIVIEHNLDVIKTADWVLDLGPEGGEEGGRVVATGTPTELARTATSHTGLALRSVVGGW